jgi:hypothetical protein
VKVLPPACTTEPGSSQKWPMYGPESRGA